MWERLSGAIQGSDAKLVRFYLEQEPDLVYEMNSNEETLLHQAARSADPETILELLRRGARADSTDEFGWTPLHEACKNNNEAAVSLFINTGINLNLKTSKQETPLHIATRHNSSSIMARLLEAGANKDAVNKNGNTALHLAAQKGFTKAIEVLMAAGANLRARNEIGLTPLHMTATKGHFRCAAILLANQANPNQLDDSGKSFLEVAEACKNFFFVIQAKSLIEELAEENHAATPEEASAIVNKPKLSDFINSQALQPENKTKTSCTQIVNGLITGDNTHKVSPLVKTLETALWFAVFPLLLFILWKGFASGALPTVINLNLSIGNLASAEFINAFANMILVFIASYLLITTETESISPLHFFKDLREAVHFRVAHLLLIELFYINKIIVDMMFVKEFAIFWAWFMVLYVMSYLMWWTNTHTVPAKKSENVTEICYAHD